MYLTIVMMTMMMLRYPENACTFHPSHTIFFLKQHPTQIVQMNIYLRSRSSLPGRMSNADDLQ